MPARRDLVRDPRIQHTLHHARLGTAYFRRVMNRLTDADLDGASLLPGWRRREVLAHVGYNARALARLVQWADTGIANPMYASGEARASEIEAGATLPRRALLSLNEHAATELNVRWRDLPEDRWSVNVTTVQGRVVPVSESVWMRTREVWLHAVDLDNGALMRDLPDDVLSRLLTDITRTWRQRGVEGVPEISVDPSGPTGPSARAVSGSLSDLVLWASGRAMPRRLRWHGGGPMPAPQWI